MHLFLDFDGVLHPRDARIDELFSRIGFIEQLLREFPEVRVVISSAWREHHALEEMRGYFADDVRHQIVDVTPLHCVADGYSRHSECIAWLRTLEEPSAGWVAVDDDALLFQPGLANLFLVDGAAGLTEIDASRLRELIRAARQR